MYYTDIGYAQARLTGTIVQLKDGTPVYVNDIDLGDGIGWRVTVLQSNKEMRVDSQQISLTPVPLGYVNFKGGDAVFYSRRPIREWKQGLSTSNIYPQPPRWPLKQLHATIVGSYPTLEEAKKTGVICAFHRDFAVWGVNDALFYRGRGVGRAVGKKFFPVIGQEYLYERFQEVVK
jgi:hypothetical protein